MSTRGLQFLNKWVLEQLPIIARGDLVTADDQLMRAAEQAGISTHEIAGEVVSVFALLSEVFRRRESRSAGSAD